MATITKKSIHFVKIRHYTFIVQCDDLSQELHNVGRVLYGQYGVGDQIQTVVFQQVNSRSGEIISATF